MTTFIKTALVALSLSTAALSGAQAQQVELVTGIGFGHSHADAMQNAVRAWINQSIRDYGSGDWNSAFKGPMSCSKQSGSGGITSFGIGVEGDASGKWSCSVSGLPLSALG